MNETAILSPATPHGHGQPDCEGLWAAQRETEGSAPSGPMAKAWDPPSSSENAKASVCDAATCTSGSGACSPLGNAASPVPGTKLQRLLPTVTESAVRMPCGSPIPIKSRGAPHL